MGEHLTAVTLVVFCVIIKTCNDDCNINEQMLNENWLDFHLFNYTNKYCTYHWIIE